jgi:PncC family amidohydrolase
MIRIHERLIQLKKTLVLAESCTGGRLAASFTAIAGCSAHFLGSFVVYSNELKKSVLQVPERLLQKNGAVSEEVAAAMLQGLFSITSADYGVAVTGIAGPSGGTPEKPVGTICAALGERNQAPKVFTFQASGKNREEIMSTTVEHLLNSLEKILY